MPTDSLDVLIVGTGHGGAQTAIMLRQLQFSGSIGLLGEENELPYERPPLSKEYLSGEKSFERLLIRPSSFWTEKQIAVLLGRKVRAVDPAAHRVVLADGTRLQYERLVWAAGGTARRLSCAGSELVGVHTVRTRADVDRMLSELPAARRVVVVGGGYIGLEAAAALRKLGKSVVLLEALDRVLGRVAGVPVSHFYEAEHRAHGVDVRLGVDVRCIEGSNGKAIGVRLAAGELIAAEIVVVGIGIVPAIRPLVEAGAIADNGVNVDKFCQTNLPDVYAIGDCASQVNSFAGGARVRLESVQNAMDQARCVAHTLTGDPQPYHAVPWFWSNQFDLRLQTVGLSIGYDDIVVRGNPATRSFSVIYLRTGTIIALDCVNATRDYAQARKLVEIGASPSREALADTTRPLKDLIDALRN